MTTAFFFFHEPFLIKRIENGYKNQEIGDSMKKYSVECLDKKINVVKNKWQILFKRYTLSYWYTNTRTDACRSLNFGRIVYRSFYPTTYNQLAFSFWNKTYNRKKKDGFFCIERHISNTYTTKSQEFVQSKSSVIE